MQLDDRLYGRFEIDEPVINDILKCKDFVRLKGVSQSGFARLRDDDPTRYSRFEHCTGVMLLLRKLGASLEEQVAGLLHDSSHTAFSHVIDDVFGTRENEDYAGDRLAEFLLDSELGEILAANGLDAKDMGEYEKTGRFQLLEQPIPALCADRVDNGLRYMLYAGIDTDSCVGKLAQDDMKMVYTSIDAARSFAFGFLDGTKKEWGNLGRSIESYYLADAIKRGIELGIASLEDFYLQDENHIVDALKNSGDSEILKDLDEIRHGPKFEIGDGKGSVFIMSKVRYVDPLIVENGKRVRLTDVDDGYKRALDEELEILRKGWRVHLM
ncbi:metal-dependent phosphohydrolase [mine drainage metagenome]|uniref:Metal-dependent phosphohydrolase n=1 Tax=mine drainage metagenome TaxID=410659 RepID=T0Y7V3_9ZZZZ